MDIDSTVIQLRLPKEVVNYLHHGLNKAFKPGKSHFPYFAQTKIAEEEMNMGRSPKSILIAKAIRENP